MEGLQGVRILVVPMSAAGLKPGKNAVHCQRENPSPLCCCSFYFAADGMALAWRVKETPPQEYRSQQKGRQVEKCHVYEKEKKYIPPLFHR